MRLGIIDNIPVHAVIIAPDLIIIREAKKILLRGDGSVDVAVQSMLGGTGEHLHPDDQTHIFPLLLLLVQLFPQGLDNLQLKKMGPVIRMCFSYVDDSALGDIVKNGRKFLRLRDGNADSRLEQGQANAVVRRSDLLFLDPAAMKKRRREYLP